MKYPCADEHQRTDYSITIQSTQNVKRICEPSNDACSADDAPPKRDITKRGIAAVLYMKSESTDERTTAKQITVHNV